MDTISEIKTDKTNLEASHEHWFTKYLDVMNGSPQGLPPLCKINHKIPLIDKNKQYSYCLPCCPEAMYPELIEKLCQYIDNG
jgi:hypothetical protein